MPTRFIVTPRIPPSAPSPVGIRIRASKKAARSSAPFSPRRKPTPSACAKAENPSAASACKPEMPPICRSPFARQSSAIGSACHIGEKATFPKLVRRSSPTLLPSLNMTPFGAAATISTPSPSASWKNATSPTSAQKNAPLSPRTLTAGPSPARQEWNTSPVSCVGNGRDWCKCTYKKHRSQICGLCFFCQPSSANASRASRSLTMSCFFWR